MTDHRLLPSITDSFVCNDDCLRCLGCGTVCEDHPNQAWEPLVGSGLGCPCGMPGMPCKVENR